MEVGAQFSEGDALDYIPAGLTVGYDARIQYCTSADADQCVSRSGLPITTVTRYGNAVVRAKDGDEPIIFPLASDDPKLFKCTTPKWLKTGGWAWSSALMMNTQGTLSNLRCTHPQLTITFVRYELLWLQ